MSYQSGVRNVIASSGTALTSDHLRSIRRLADEVLLCFDSDVAGSDAAERAIDLAEANDFAVKVATYRGGFKDAAEAAKADPENVTRTIAAAISAPLFYFEKYLPADMSQLQSREGLAKLRVVLGKLRNMSSPVERDFWMKELAKRTGINEKTLEEETQRSATSEFSQPAARSEDQEQQTQKRQLSRHELIAEELLALALARNDFSLIEDCVRFFTPTQTEIYTLLKSGVRKHDDPALDAAIGLIVMRDPSTWIDAKDDDIAVLKNGIAQEYYKERRHILTLAIKNAEARGNDAELSAALAELSKLPRAGEQ
jgi:DNA primase